MIPFSCPGLLSDCWIHKAGQFKMIFELGKIHVRNLIANSATAIVSNTLFFCIPTIKLQRLDLQGSCVLPACTWQSLGHRRLSSFERWDELVLYPPWKSCRDFLLSLYFCSIGWIFRSAGNCIHLLWSNTLPSFLGSKGMLIKYSWLLDFNLFQLGKIYVQN